MSKFLDKLSTNTTVQDNDLLYKDNKVNRKSYALYQIVTLAVTLSGPNRPKVLLLLKFCVFLRIFGTGVARVLEFCM